MRSSLEDHSAEQLLEGAFLNEAAAKIQAIQRGKASRKARLRCAARGDRF